jgi:hypothetical protein
MVTKLKRDPLAPLLCLLESVQDNESYLWDTTLVSCLRINLNNKYLLHSFKGGMEVSFQVPPPKRRLSRLPPPKWTAFGGQAQRMPVAVGTLFVGLLHSLHKFGAVPPPLEKWW